ncbi:MAG: 4Fe-4S binding protein [Clostridia bacterium]|nr:4Fe-4S binding protein [Clostridia bacterium]
MTKLFTKLKSLIPTKRRLIQLYTALLFNANIKGFISGQIYKGPLKNACAPGLNCYSCPGASGACPLGSLQNAFANSGKRTPYYVIGIILLYGIILGRTICGFLCPFGLIQELLHKIPTPKLKKNKFTKVLSYLKYVILVFLVVIVPILYGIRNVPLPAFCKYICPAGTLEGAIGLLYNKVNESSLGMLGPLFTWKFALLVAFIVGSIFIYRFFCRFFCPLGALYGLFNKFSILGIKLEKSACVDCGRCINKCKVDISHVGDHECVNCGECLDVCPTNAIRWSGSKIFLPPNEIDAAKEKGAPLDDVEKAELEVKRTKVKKRNLVLQITAAVLAAALLASALVYYNFIYEEPHTIHVDENGDDYCDECRTLIGNEVGYPCYGYDIKLVDENGLTGETFNPANNRDKITIINFWGVWCSGCLKELPYFDRIASEYSDSVTVFAVHTVLDFDSAMGADDYIREHYPDSEMLFGKDETHPSATADEYYTMLGGTGAYPITIILDGDGIIIEKFMHEVTYEELRAVVEGELN